MTPTTGRAFHHNCIELYKGGADAVFKALGE